MKKFTLIAAAALMGMSASAQDVNWGNPKAADGTYIVHYDLENGKFFDENKFEFDETFVFALDVTGTPLEEAMGKKDQFAAGDWAGLLGLGVAYDIYMVSNGEDAPGGSVDGRLMHIKDNLYGMTFNFYQHFCRPGKKQGMRDKDGNIPALEVGNVASFNENFFGFGWSESNPGFMWWDAVAAPIQGTFEFHTAPYTGTKTSEEYTFGNIVPADECPFEGLDPGSYHSMCDEWGGYARPTLADYNAAIGNTAINEVNMGAADVVATEYFDVMGRKLNAALENGVTIRRELLSNGKAQVTKVVK